MTSFPRWLRYSLIIGMVTGVCALFGIVVSTGNTKYFDRYFLVLMLLNVGMVSVLVITIGSLIFRLVRRIRSKTFGTRLTVRLATTTFFIALTPTIIIYLLSMNIVNLSINNWFDVRVESGLESGVTITRGLLQSMQRRTDSEAKRIAQALSRTPPTLVLPELLKQVDNKQGLEAVVFTPNGSAVASAGSHLNALLPDIPSHLQLQAAVSQGFYSVIEGADFNADDPEQSNGLKIRVIVKIPALQSNEEFVDNATNFSLSRKAHQPLYLQLLQTVSEEVSQNAFKLTEGYREYQAMALSRTSMERIYKFTLSLMLLTATMFCIIVSLSFAKRAIEPISQLARGTRRLANNDFMPIKEFTGNSEFNELTRSFNLMIKQLHEAQKLNEKQRVAAEQASSFLASVLTNISSGVIVLSNDGKILSINNSAHKILKHLDLQEGEMFQSYIPDLFSIFEEKRTTLNSQDDKFAFEYEIERNEKILPLYIQGCAAYFNDVPGMVIVFDDLSQLIHAQRAEAWGEVARRLAHEIKNPLTPIRLSAERLEWRLSKKLEDPKDIKLVKNTTATITMQVDALTQMINDFREYAKLPETKLQALNLNEFIEKTVDLYHHAGINVELVLDKTCPDILGDKARLRQVVHNLLSNCVEANIDKKHVDIIVKTQTVTAIDQPTQPTAVKLLIMDNGPGFDEKVLNSAFEPYVTTKPTGSGLGLPMVKKILDEHDAAVKLVNIENPITHEVIGACVAITFKVAKDLVLSKSREHL